MLPNLVKYCVDCFSLLLSLFLSCWVRLWLHQSPSGWWIPQRGYCPAHNKKNITIKKEVQITLEGELKSETSKDQRYEFSKERWSILK